MKVFRNVDAAPEGKEVLLFCLVRGDQTAILARRHWFAEGDNTRRLGWQSTYDGAEVPAEWSPYAYGTFDVPDPGSEDVV